MRLNTLRENNNIEIFKLELNLFSIKYMIGKNIDFFRGENIEEIISLLKEKFPNHINFIAKYDNDHITFFTKYYRFNDRDVFTIMKQYQVSDLYLPMYLVKEIIDIVY